MNRLDNRIIRPVLFRWCTLFKWRKILVIYIILLAAPQGADAIRPLPSQATPGRPVAGLASSAAIDSIVGLAQQGQAVTRSPAAAGPVDRTGEWVSRAGEWISRIPDEPLTGTAMLLAMLLLAAATLVSEDLTCISAGLLVARGTMGIIPAVAASFSGILIGDILLYLAGRFIGRPALKIPPFKWLVKEADIKRTSDWFAARGPIIILTSRFTPGLRLPTYFAAGVLGTRFWQFVFYFSLAVALWTPLLVGLSAAVGNRMFAYYDLFGRYALLIVFATIGLLLVVAKFIIPLFSYRGRRLLFSSARRAARWEFWPSVLFYLPLTFYFLYLSLRFRSPTLFTACNPGISEVGFLQESKSRILDKLTGCAPNVARHRLIHSSEPASAKMGLATDFLQQHSLDYPVVLTPDVDRCNEDAIIVRSAQQLEQYLAEANSDLMIREHIAGREYSIVFCRYPNEASGRIVSITEKRLLKLTGDGQSTIEQLIWQDDHTLLTAPYHLRKHGDQLFRVLDQGEEYDLSEAENNRHGLWLLDGSSIWTAELEATIDRLSKSVDGYCWGRYDIVASSVDNLRIGRNYTIVGLSGVCLAPNRIYSPDTDLWQAYANLMRQWRMAFDIGAANRRRGCKPVSLRKLVGLIVKRITGQSPATVN